MIHVQLVVDGKHPISIGFPNSGSTLARPSLSREIKLVKCLISRISLASINDINSKWISKTLSSNILELS